MISQILNNTNEAGIMHKATGFEVLDWQTSISKIMKSQDVFANYNVQD